MQDVIVELERIRRRARRLLVVQRVAATIAWSILAVLLVVLVDYVARWPRAIRSVQLLALLAALGWVVWTYIGPALRFRPSLATIALRLERHAPALRGRLAAAVEFFSTGAAEQSSLARRAVRDAESRVQGVSLESVLAPRLTARRTASATILLAGVVAGTVFLPVHTSIALQRVFNPFADTQWPKRTGVVALTDIDVHPRGEALPLRAQVVRGMSDRMRVQARYRLGIVEPSGDTAARSGVAPADRVPNTGRSPLDSGGVAAIAADADPPVTFGPWRTVVLTHQRDGLFERLIEPDADLIEFLFVTDDDETSAQRIRLVPPPAILSARLLVEPPAYAEGTVEPLDIELGPGTDNRAAAPRALLRGSTATLMLTFNKPIGFSPGPAGPVEPESGAAPDRASADGQTSGGPDVGAANASTGAPGAGWRERLGFTMAGEVRPTQGRAPAEHGSSPSSGGGIVIDATDGPPLSFAEALARDEAARQAATDGGSATGEAAATLEEPGGPSEPVFLPLDLALADAAADPGAATAESTTAVAQVWILEWPLLGDTRIEPDLVDADGISGRDRPAYRIDVIEDRPPTVAMLDPAADEAVLASAEVPLLAEARDDVGVINVELLARRVQGAGIRGTGSSAGSATPPPPTSGGETLPPSTATPPADGAGFRSLRRVAAGEPVERIDSTLRLFEFEPQPGDVIEVLASAVDAYAGLDGSPRDPVQSSPRRIRVIDETAFVEQLRTDLDAVRRNAMRLADEQRDLRQRTGATASPTPDDPSASEPADAADPEARSDAARPAGGDQQLAREQARLTQGIARQRESMERLGDRLERNRLSDDDLQRIVSEARRLLDEAGAASVTAAEQLAGESPSGAPAAPEEQAGADADAERPQTENTEEAPGDPAAREVDASQTEVEEALARVAQLLDQGRDAWAVQFQMQRLLADQENLEARTQQLNEQTRGRSRSELTDEERRALDGLAEEQAELANRARALSEELRKQAEAIRERGDMPELAEALEEAADRAEREQLEQQAEDASEQIRENQGELAMRSQRQAAQTLRQMIEGVDRAQQARAERLLRQLDDLLASLDSLIDLQRQALADLGRAATAGGAAAAEQARSMRLDEGMVRINGNTLAVIEVAAAAGAELMSAAVLIREAADAQANAIRGLRAETIPFEEVATAEQLSLNSLLEARNLAQRMQDQLEAEELTRKQQELMAFYRQLADEQLGVRNQTAELLGMRVSAPEGGENAEARLEIPDEVPPLGRRERLAVRRLAVNQQAVRESASALLDDVEELLEVPTFDAGHKQIDAVARSVTDRMQQGDADLALVLDQGDIAAQLNALADALAQAVDQSEFARNNQGAQGGGGGSGGGQGQEQQQEQPLIPPIAELKLLRGLQENLHRSTRQLNDLAARLPQDVRDNRMLALAASQQSLVDLADGLMERLQQQMGPGQQGPAGGPGESGGGSAEERNEGGGG